MAAVIRGAIWSVKSVMTNTKKTQKNAASLLSPESMGGIVAGEGHDFQTRYAACHLPIWLLDGLHQLLFEGTGDIDVRFLKCGASTRIHIQVKDHEVSLGDLKKIIKHFRDLDESLPTRNVQEVQCCLPIAGSQNSPH